MSATMKHTIVMQYWGGGPNMKCVRVRPEGHEACNGEHDIVCAWIIGMDGKFYGPSLSWKGTALLSAVGAIEFADAIYFCAELQEPELEPYGQLTPETAFPDWEEEDR